MTLYDQSVAMETGDLFNRAQPIGYDRMGPHAYILRRFALQYVDNLLAEIARIDAASPFRHMITPGGWPMSVALTNCGEWGWTTNQQGYCYSRLDPNNRKTWPDMPEIFKKIAYDATKNFGIGEFIPDACLINRYVPGAKLSLHQDKNEKDFSAPIVSISLGMTALFLFGGKNRSDKTAKFELRHGDVAVWGGGDRLRYHGIMPIKSKPHFLLGNQRINFTLRKAGPI